MQHPNNKLTGTRYKMATEHPGKNYETGSRSSAVEVIVSIPGDLGQRKYNDSTTIGLWQ